MDFVINDNELAALCGLPHIQQLAYLRGIPHIPQQIFNNTQLICSIPNQAAFLEK